MISKVSALAFVIASSDKILEFVRASPQYNWLVAMISECINLVFHCHRSPAGRKGQKARSRREFFSRVIAVNADFVCFP